MKQHSSDDTIAAISTPIGNGAIAIVRISGKDAITIAEKISSRSLQAFPSHTLHKISIFDHQNIVDESMIAVMRSPRSYTGEDLVEIHCHGGSLIPQKILDLLTKQGARAALPGEFTYRAFLHQKIDLSQAEAVQEVISAQNELSLKMAQKHLQGELQEQISLWHQRLMEMYASMEAWINFPEDLEEISLIPLCEKIKDILQEIQKLLDTYHDGKRIFSGIDIAIVGTPNVGKSSLLNLLSKKERAIVSSIPGTTRDLLEEDITIGPLHCRITDTAGIRTSEEMIEQEGIKRARKKIEEADVLILVLDAQKGLDSEDQALLDLCPEDATIICWNKTDIALPPSLLPRKNVLLISVLQKKGLDLLKEKILEASKFRESSSTELMITNIRHKNILENTLTALQTAHNSLQEKMSPDLVASDLRYSLDELSKILGTNVDEGVLETIFSRFCLGK
ncbi:MAG: tRNA uridine-5-carboxymethylaminomethyl(34) synthesis GTPase MnmE [Parachlamydiales bacterium]|nr:tRNA uridine-5-carboxymethylaminomethyl(34) synthesis GTPase MnmE [Parachlamydiales bacterium]